MPRKSRTPAIPEKPADRDKEPKQSRAARKARLKEPAESIVQLDLLDHLANFGKEQAGRNGASPKPRQRRARPPRA